MARKSVAVGSSNEAAAVWVDTSKLKPWAKNPRVNDATVDKVAESINRFGFSAPIIARQSTGEVIAGHTRLKAAIKLGLARVPVRYMDLTEKEAHLLALADNKLNELSAWDHNLLSSITQDFDEADMMLAGWSSADLDILNPVSVPREGASEVNVDAFEYKHACPKCGFNYNDEKR